MPLTFRTNWSSGFKLFALTFIFALLSQFSFVQQMGENGDKNFKQELKLAVV